MADFVYAAHNVRPRITQGAFRMCIQTLYKHATGRELEYVQYGKPSAGTFAYAESMLRAQQQLLRQTQDKFDTIYMIGDNPLSDIQGANEAGEPWFSILVRTGVFQGGDNDLQHPAKYVCGDIEEAFKFICEREGIQLPLKR